MSDHIEVNFDGLVGPTHNFAALSPGNVASALNGGSESQPRAAAIEGLEKMRQLIRLGLVQGFFPPQRRPATDRLAALGFAGSLAERCAQAAREDPALLVRLSSASSMWTANAATVIAAPDSGDGRVHLVTANLATMMHRAVEADETFAMLARVFRDGARFAVHPPLRPARHLGDEGAANHMRIAPAHGAAGVNIFVYGEAQQGDFPARQSRRAGEAVARLAGLKPGGALFLPQAGRAVQAGAFHNDVVAVANETVVLFHADAFEDGAAAEAQMRAAMPGLHLIRIDGIGLDEAVKTYLFNSQLVSLPEGGAALILPREVKDHGRAWAAVERILAGDNPVRRAIVVDVRGSMRNGGGPACLRLRVPMPRAALDGVDPAFLLSEARIDGLQALVERWWPDRIAPADLLTPDLWAAAGAASDALERHIAGH